MIDQLTEHDRIELLARAQDAWDRAPQNTMKAVFEWRGKTTSSHTRQFSYAFTLRKASGSTKRKGVSASLERPPRCGTSVKSAVKSSTVEPAASEASMKAASTKAASVTTVTAAATGRHVERILSAGRGRWSRVGT
jgi:hypothetical protein